MSSSTPQPLISKRPRVGITIGDAAGIGPEIVLKSLFEPSISEFVRPIVIGEGRILRSTAASLGHGFGEIEVIDLQNLSSNIRPGAESAETGRASGQFIEKAVDLWRNGEIDAIATAPISKKALNAGGYDFPGHTEFLASLTNTQDFAMSFFAQELRVVLLSTHLSLLDAIALVTKDNLIRLIEFTSLHLSRLIKRPVRLAVAGLNPHASENGMFGTEEAEQIAPAVAYCRDELGIDASGPFSPDTIFLRGHRGEFDAVVACYHDQATIAVKSISFGSAVNVTLGLPLIRTSVDHGTALDIAGKGIADASSMSAAIKLAGELATLHTHTASTT